MTGEHTRRVADARNIPMETVTRKAKKTAIGLGAVGLGLSIAIWLIPPLSPWCVYPLLLYGGYCVAGDLARGFGEWLPAFLRDLATGVRDVYAAVRGNGTSSG